MIALVLTVPLSNTSETTVNIRIVYTYFTDISLYEARVSPSTDENSYIAKFDSTQSDLVSCSDLIEVSSRRG